MKTKQIANEIKEILVQKGLKVQVSWSTDTMFIDIYKDDYDYSQVILKYLEDKKAEEYASIVISIINDKENRDKYVKDFKASPVKRFLIDLIKNYNCEDFLFVHENELYGNFENGNICIDDIVDFSYSPFGDVLKLQEDQGGDEYFYTIDFKNRTIEARVELLENVEA